MFIEKVTRKVLEAQLLLKVQSEKYEILEKIRNRRDEYEEKAYEAQKKVEETKTKITLRGIEREKKIERFQPEDNQEESAQ